MTITAVVPAPGGRLSGPILARVSQERGVGVRDLCGESRRDCVVRARQEAYYRLADETQLSLRQIARALGRTDHSTVIHGIRTHAARTGLPLPKVRMQLRYKSRRDMRHKGRGQKLHCTRVLRRAEILEWMSHGFDTATISALLRINEADVWNALDEELR